MITDRRQRKGEEKKKKGLESAGRAIDVKSESEGEALLY
jgi:hypothetical protein